MHLFVGYLTAISEAQIVGRRIARKDVEERGLTLIGRIEESHENPGENDVSEELK
jgi:hypothetical protein